jgi:hypothetical protein
VPIVEVAVENDRNANWFCLPLGKKLRGRIDFLRANDLSLAREYPQGVPGQRLSVDTDTGEAVVIDPLHEPGNAAVRDKLARRFNVDACPAREPVRRADVASLLYWLKRAVAGGLVRVVRGTLPDKVDGAVRKRYLYGDEPTRDDEDRLLKRQELAAKLAMMTPKQREEYDRLLADSA